MTGYGVGESGGFKVEVRSTNHKSLHIQVNLPPYLYFYEPEIRNMVKERFHRGYIEIFFSRLENSHLRLKIDKSLARQYYQALISLKDELSIPGNVGIDVLAQQKDIFLVEEPEFEIGTLHKAIETALEELKKTRIQEGKVLLDDIEDRLRILNKQVMLLEDKRDEFVSNAKKTLMERLKSLIGDKMIDEHRLIQEVAILVERSDITEEIVRIKSHLKRMEEFFHESDIVGKKAGFFIQELNRELNTIGAKSSSAEITSIVVDMKYEIEKIREQVQNLQ
jgi:uncharacterized protein (TIGR00255 family)